MRKLILLLCLASGVQAQTGIGWTTPSTAGSPWPGGNGGFISLTNAFDALSNTTVAYVQSSAASTVQVTNGQATVNWISGDYFSILWHYPNTIKINGTTVTIASGTPPSSCTAGVPLSCTVLRLASNWTGASSSTASLVATHLGGIYSDAIMYYNATANTWTWGPRWGNLDDLAVTSTTGFNLPPMRQNSGFYWIDTLRHRLYLGTGVNQAVKIPSITTNGTATVAVVAATSRAFVQGTMWVGLTASFPNATSPTTVCTIVSVQSESSMTVGSCSSGFPSGITALQITAPDLPENSFDNNAVWDLWYLTLNANPASNTFTKVPLGTYNLQFPGYNDTSVAYDPDDDCSIIFGAPANAGSHTTWVFCSADSPGNGTPTARQNAMVASGGVTSNVWQEVLSSGSPISHPPGVYAPGLVYDTVHHQVVQFGGSSTDTIGHFQTRSLHVLSNVLRRQPGADVGRDGQH